MRAAIVVVTSGRREDAYVTFWLGQQELQVQGRRMGPLVDDLDGTDYAQLYEEVLGLSRLDRQKGQQEEDDLRCTCTALKRLAVLVQYCGRPNERVRRCVRMVHTFGADFESGNRRMSRVCPRLHWPCTSVSGSTEAFLHLGAVYAHFTSVPRTGSPCAVALSCHRCIASGTTVESLGSAQS